MKGSNAAAGNTVLKKILNTVHSSTGSLHHEPPNIGIIKKNGFAEKISCIGNHNQHSPQCDLASVSAAKAVNQTIPYTFPASFSDVTIISWTSLIILLPKSSDPWKYIYCCLKSYPTFCGLNTVLSTDMTTQPTQYNTAYLKFITSCAMFESIPWSFQERAYINILLLPLNRKYPPTTQETLVGFLSRKNFMYNFHATLQ